MTNLLQGHDGPPSVAALAVEVSALRRDVEAVTGKADTLAQTAQEHSAALDGVGELRSQVERILALLTEDDQNTLTGWFWLTMNAEAREERIGELADWVNTVLRTQYPGYLTGQIRPCWPNHPEALWELTWLYQLWTHAYLTKRPALKNAADWHDRWTPGVLRRLGQVMALCEEACQRHPALAALDGP